MGTSARTCELVYKMAKEIDPDNVPVPDEAHVVGGLSELQAPLPRVRGRVALVLTRQAAGPLSIPSPCNTPPFCSQVVGDPTPRDYMCTDECRSTLPMC